MLLPQDVLATFPPKFRDIPCKVGRLLWSSSLHPIYLPKRRVLPGCLILAFVVTCWKAEFSPSFAWFCSIPPANILRSDIVSVVGFQLYLCSVTIKIMDYRLCCLLAAFAVWPGLSLHWVTSSGWIFAETRWEAMTAWCFWSPRPPDLDSILPKKQEGACLVNDRDVVTWCLRGGGETKRGKGILHAALRQRSTSSCCSCWSIGFWSQVALLAVDIFSTFDGAVLGPIFGIFWCFGNMQSWLLGFENFKAFHLGGLGSRLGGFLGRKSRPQVYSRRSAAGSARTKVTRCHKRKWFCLICHVPAFAKSF